MSKFCGKCGGELDDKTGLCPNCDADKLSEKNRIDSLNNNPRQVSTVANRKPAKLTRKQKKAIKKANRTTAQKIRIVLVKILVILLVVLVLISAGSILLAYNHLIEIPVVSRLFDNTNIDNNSTDLGNNEGQYTVTAPDAKEYYENNSKIVSKTNVQDSENTTTEKETVILLKERGFEMFPITTNYNLEGEYIGSEEITEISTKHPSYQTFYQTKNEEIWTIFVVNGVIMANPVSYNLQSKLNAQVIISENKSVVSYDSTTNMFYETIPDKSALIVKQVKQINAETLEGLDIEGIDKL